MSNAIDAGMHLNKTREFNPPTEGNLSQIGECFQDVRPLSKKLLAEGAKYSLDQSLDVVLRNNATVSLFDRLFENQIRVETSAKSLFDGEDRWVDTKLSVDKNTFTSFKSGFEAYFKESSVKSVGYFSVIAPAGALAVNLTMVQRKSEELKFKRALLAEIRESVDLHMPGAVRKVERLKAWLEYRVTQDLYRSRLRMKVLAPHDYNALPPAPFDQRWLLTDEQHAYHKSIATEIKEIQATIDEVNKRLRRAGAKYDEYSPRPYTDSDKKIVKSVAIGATAVAGVVAVYLAAKYMPDAISFLYTDTNK